MSTTTFNPPPYPIDPPNIPGSFTYDFGTNPQVSMVRLLISDTAPGPPPLPLFNDAEINAALFQESSQNLYVSGMQTQGGASPQVPVQVYSVYRSAALLLDGLSANKALLASVQRLLDVEVNPAKASQELRALAAEYRKVEANAGHWAIAEMVNNQFQARERIVAQLLRLYGG